jgi:hypothetical protein
MTHDPSIFVRLCKERRLGMLRAPANRFKDIKETLQKEMMDNFGPSSWFSAACDMRLFCPACRVEFAGSFIDAIDGTLDDIRESGATVVTLYADKEIPDQLAAAAEFRCHKCGAREILAFYDNWDPGEITESDIRTLHALWRARAHTSFWREKLRAGSECRLCDRALSADSARVLSAGHGGYDLICLTCCKELLSSAVDDLRKNSCHFGSSPAELRDARNYLRGSYVLEDSQGH